MTFDLINPRLKVASGRQTEKGDRRTSYAFDWLFSLSSSMVSPKLNLERSHLAREVIQGEA